MNNLQILDLVIGVFKQGGNSDLDVAVHPSRFQKIATDSRYCVCNVA